MQYLPAESKDGGVWVEKREKRKMGTITGLFLVDFKMSLLDRKSVV